MKKAAIITVSPKHVQHAEKIKVLFDSLGVVLEQDFSDERMPIKISKLRESGYEDILVIGDVEVDGTRAIAIVCKDKQRDFNNISDAAIYLKT